MFFLHTLFNRLKHPTMTRRSVTLLRKSVRRKKKEGGRSQRVVYRTRRCTRSKLTKRAGGANETQTLRPLSERTVKGTCNTCGKPIYSDESRTRDEGNRRHHAKCLVIIRGKCFYCGENVYNNEHRSTMTVDGEEHYYHEECGGNIRGSITDATGIDGW